jgi:hypothetical protein
VKSIFNVLLCKVFFHFFSFFFSSSERDDSTEKFQDGRGIQIAGQIKLAEEMVVVAAPIRFPIRVKGRTNYSTQLQRSKVSGSGKLSFSTPRHDSGHTSRF